MRIPMFRKVDLDSLPDFCSTPAAARRLRNAGVPADEIVTLVASTKGGVTRKALVKALTKAPYQRKSKRPDSDDLNEDVSDEEDVVDDDDDDAREEAKKKKAKSKKAKSKKRKETPENPHETPIHHPAGSPLEVALSIEERLDALERDSGIVDRENQIDPTLQRMFSTSQGFEAANVRAFDTTDEYEEPAIDPRLQQLSDGAQGSDAFGRKMLVKCAKKLSRMIKKGAA
jgi:hypothetical protein